MSVDFTGSNYSDSFIGDLVDFVAADSFQTKFEKFFVENALEFDFESEHKLKYYEIYQRFQSMFETQLETFCQQQRMTQSEFVRRCREASGDDEKVGHYINILLSSVEYETFIKLMKIMRPVAEIRRAKAESKDGSGIGRDEKSLVSPAKATPSKSAPDDTDYADEKMTELEDFSDAKSPGRRK